MCVCVSLNNDSRISSLSLMKPQKVLSDPRDESLMLYHKSKVDREAYIAFKSVNAGLERQFA